jgi:hypothetical protein
MTLPGCATMKFFSTFCVYDSLQKMPTEQRGAKEAKIRRQDPAAADRHFVFCLLKTRDGRKTSRVRHELEVNMRESERQRLARRDAYERDLERRARKNKDEACPSRELSSSAHRQTMVSD